MAIRGPGKIAVRATLAPSLRASSRALPSLGPRAGGRRSLTAGISVTSMIDVMVVLVVFLLLTFSAGAQPPTRHDVPSALNVEEILDAPIVDVSRDGIFVDGARVATSSDVALLTNDPRGNERIEGLHSHLEAKHDRAKMLEPDRAVPSRVILSIDPEAPASLVKRIVKTAAESGYPSVDFMVQKG